MRVLLLTVCLFLCGCRPESPQSQREVVDATGTNLLAMVQEVVGRSLIGGKVYHDFHSLVWRTKVGTNWIDQRVVSQAAFQTGSARRRWVNDIDSLNASNGTAVIKVAEESLPFTNGGNIIINIVYSWREWNLLTNGGVRVLRVCKDPFEKYQRYEAATQQGRSIADLLQTVRPPDCFRLIFPSRFELRSRPLIVLSAHVHRRTVLHVSGPASGAMWRASLEH